MSLCPKQGKAIWCFSPCLMLNRHTLPKVKSFKDSFLLYFHCISISVFCSALTSVSTNLTTNIQIRFKNPQLELFARLQPVRCMQETSAVDSDCTDSLKNTHSCCRKGLEEIGLAADHLNPVSRA